MAWANDPESRRRSDATYRDPVYLRNKATVRRRSGGRCEWVEDGRRCGSRDRVQCDHRIPRSQGGGHEVGNLWDLCRTHHNRKTSAEGNAARNRRTGTTDPDCTPRTRW